MGDFKRAGRCRCQRRPAPAANNGMPRYRRLKAPAATYFFTVVLADRRQALLIDNIDLLRAAVVRTRRDLPFDIAACVILPEHLHCIWTLPPNDADFSERWRLVKARFSQSIDGLEPVSASRARRRERGIWQRGFWDHVIRDDDDLTAHLNYVHYNPVKHGYVKRAADWTYSTFHRYVREGLYPVDWASSAEDRGSFGE